MLRHDGKALGSGRKTESYPALRCNQDGSCALDLELIGEEPLLIRIEGQPYAVVMRTPGEELFNAAGFCLSEGVADTPQDFTTIGKAFMNRCLDRASLLVLSSRISYELIQKAARAQLPIMISNSRPTALAVEMGKALDMTLAFPAAQKELIVVCGDMRITGK